MLLFIILAPFIGFLINAFLGRKLPKAVSGGVAVAALLASFGLSLAAAAQIFGAPADQRVLEQTVFTWMSSGDFTVPFALRLDPLSTVMILVITGIGSLIHIYSTSYMHEERDGEYARYFSYLNLFVAFMLTLVLGASFPIMFVGWEGVGLCSYLLIGFWFSKKSATDAGKKAFIVNRIGDFAFILGMFGAFVTFGTLDFTAIAQKVATMPVELTWGVLSITTLLFFIGATGKSAQIPLYVWLPDAMEGPTPVSALIHAATMVTAGVYMIGRNAELFAHAPHTMQVVAVIGALTALMAGTIGLVQNDIKRVLAYSTVSQLGYMFLAMGVGAFSAGVFHLYTHAFFKALMFLGSGSVIHAMAGEQDMRKMGGLKKYMPITYWTFVIGAAAIAGVPGLAGFFSKDEILFQAYYTGHTGLWAIGALTGLLTACYMFRLIFMTFHGKERFEVAGHDGHDAHPSTPLGASAAHGHDAHGHGHDTHAAHDDHSHGHGHHGAPHESPWAMAGPLVLLALGSVAAGYVGVPHALGGSNAIETFLHPAFHPAAAAHGPAVAGGDHGAPAGDHAMPAMDHGAPAVADGGHEAPASEHGAAAEHADPAKTQTELTLMGVSTVLAFVGIGLAAFFFLQRPEAADGAARSLAPLHRLLLNKYYVDEIYDAAIVHPLRDGSSSVLWKTVDARIIDGAVNGTGHLVRESAGALRLLQTGSVRVYAASLFTGALLVLGYFLAR
ncbi:NADH-quinone oxidoreductase subunit L [Luteitalea sp. TBR-22]|uniref:NADH-quinone oxidoreductase subunit L n=1 Tax=Luteitalea sp. TBR-22 TaxID=2802971 RepID=UPI001AFAE1DB|nr:NADH-quinone oxidoreductase subunit L [Luteitalea sp. TBR-22]BCS34662.1 NADH-quinone oxidoreductase subunit L [Luteitalea sp. TBR-22]